MPGENYVESLPVIAPPINLFILFEKLVFELEDPVFLAIQIKESLHRTKKLNASYGLRNYLCLSTTFITFVQDILDYLKKMKYLEGGNYFIYKVSHK